MPASEPLHRYRTVTDPAHQATSLVLRIAMIILLVVCLAKMPYGYYQFVRFAAMVSFGIMAFLYYNSNKLTLAIFFGCLSLLFQPFFKVALGRTMWNVVDVVVAVILLLTLLNDAQTKR